MDLDCMAEAVAKLNAKTEPNLITIASARSFKTAVRVGRDQVEGAAEFVENELVARCYSLRGGAGTDLKCS
jgi:hypothetical protein